MNVSNHFSPSFPATWREMKLKHVANLKSGETITSESISKSGEYPVMGGNGLRGYTSSFTHSGNYILIGRQGALCGNINYASGNFWASEHAIVTDIKGNDDVKWLGELLHSMNLNQYSQSAAQPGISVETISNLKIPVPPITQQKKISYFLDRETTHIDTLIAEKTHMLSLLEEKRSSLDWLGDIPSHWNPVRIKYLITELTQGTSPQASNTPAEPSEDGVLKLSAVSKGRFVRSENKALRESDGSEHFLSLRKGDVLITRGNTPELVADACFVPQDEPNLLIPDLIYRLRVNPEKIIPELLSYFLVTKEAKTQIRRDARGSSGSMVKVSQEHVASWIIPIPPTIAEQEKIVHEITQTERRLSFLSDELRESVRLLKERRSALITAAVTGQIDLEEISA